MPACCQLLPAFAIWSLCAPFPKRGRLREGGGLKFRLPSQREPRGKNVSSNFQKNEKCDKMRTESALDYQARYAIKEIIYKKAALSAFCFSLSFAPQRPRRLLRIRAGLSLGWNLSLRLFGQAGFGRSLHGLRAASNVRFGRRSSQLGVGLPLSRGGARPHLKPARLKSYILVKWDTFGFRRSRSFSLRG